MTKLSLLLALAGVSSAMGCKHKPAATKSAPGSAASGSGSAAAMAGSGSAGSAQPAAITTADFEADFLGCWDALDEAKWDAYKHCYADTATYEMPGTAITARGPDAIVARARALKAEFPDLKGQVQLALVNGHHLAAFTLITGTNTGPLQTPNGAKPATNKKVGFYTSQLLELNDQGQVTKEREYVDVATPMGQLQPDPHHPVRPVEDKLALPASGAEAKDDAKEQANVETAEKLVAAFNAHDAKAFAALLDDHVVWTENTAGKDTNKAETVKASALRWKSAKETVAQQWGAGDFVVTSGTMDGANTPVPFLELDEIENGKVMHAWLFETK
jgi:predicted ester cyclase